MPENEILRSVRIAKPCPMSWNEMKGDERIRHCDSCNLNVFNFSNMTGAEITDLLQNANGRVCGRFYRRADGMMMTADCRQGMSPKGFGSRFPVLAVGVFLFAAIGAAFTRPSAEEDSYAMNPVIENARTWPLIGSVVDKIWPRWVSVGDISFTPPSGPGAGGGP